MKIQKNTFYLFALLVVVALAAYVFLGSTPTKSGITGNVVNTGNGDTQKVVIGMKDFNYYPQEIRVEAGKPVEISLDDSVGGCFRDFTIREFGIHEYLATPQDTVIFTPTKPGRYTFACSMNMGSGTLIVE